MATLTAGVITQINKALMKALSHVDYDGTIDVTSPQLETFLGNLDSFMDTNETTINQAIEQPMRAALSAEQKALGLILILIARYLRNHPQYLFVLRSVIDRVLEA